MLLSVRAQSWVSECANSKVIPLLLPLNVLERTQWHTYTKLCKKTSLCKFSRKQSL